MDGGQVSFTLAFAAGVASFLSPCVLPVVPGYVGFVTGVTLDGARSAESGAAIVLFGLSLLGLVRLPLLLQERRVQLAAKPVGMLGSVLVGVAFGAGWTPCIGPVLASILLYAGVSATVLRGAALLAVYALGLGIPFFVAAVGFNWFLSRAPLLRRWLLPIERAAGAVMVVAGALLFSGRLSVLARIFAR